MERSEIRGRSTSLNAAPGLRCASSGLQRQQEKEAERRQARNPTVRTCGRGAHPAGRARLSAFHHDARCSDRTPQLSSSYALPGTWSERAIPMVRKIVHLATHSRVTSGRYPLLPVPVQRHESQTGHHAGRAYPPEPPGSGGDEPPPAGAALAPPAGVTGWRPLSERDSLHRS
jgi:hypothetical protein